MSDAAPTIFVVTSPVTVRESRPKLANKGVCPIRDNLPIAGGARLDYLPADGALCQLTITESTVKRDYQLMRALKWLRQLMN